MRSALRSSLGHALAPWIGAAAILGLYAAIGLATRPLTPVDETRYATVAWEMWLRGDFLVPYLDGAPYPHKPPLLFWLITAGWSLFGVGETWPRLLPALFALAALGLLRRLARELGPECPEIARSVPALLLASLAFPALATFLAFDMLLTVWVLLGALGVARAWRRGGAGGWILLGLAFGGGVLAKGPVVYLHLLPLALLAPWWSGGGGAVRAAKGWRWFAPLAAAAAGGMTLSLAWAVPAAIAGGPAYRDAIFLNQTAGRLVESFQHARPVWWYLPLLPVIFFPLAWWPPFWRGMRAALRQPRTALARFCLAWALPPFVAFSLISGKQPQYLLPFVPALVLLVACGLALEERVLEVQRRLVGPALGLAALALALFVVAARGEVSGVTLFRPGLVVAAGIAAAFVAGCAARCRTNFENARRGLALIGLAVFAGAHTVFAAGLSAAYDVGPMARFVAAAEARGEPVAFLGEYHGRYQFVGRLTRRVEEIRSVEAEAWAARHPGGWVVDVWETPRFGPAEPELTTPFKARHARVWRAAGLRSLAPLAGSPTEPGVNSGPARVSPRSSPAAGTAGGGSALP